MRRFMYFPTQVAAWAWILVQNITTDASNGLTGATGRPIAVGSLTDADDCIFSFTTVEITQDLEIGLTTKSTVDFPGVGYNDMEYSFYIATTSRRVGIVESQNVRIAPSGGSAHVSSLGDTLSIHRVVNTIEYRINGVLFYTSLTSAAGKTLRAAVAAYGTSTIMIGSATFTG